jgi:hypothetical protein
MATSGGGARKRTHPQDNDSEKIAESGDAPGVETRTRVEQVVHAADDVLDDIEEALRASLDLDKDASDELFAERAAAMVAGYQQKGGQ